MQEIDFSEYQVLLVDDSHAMLEVLAMHLEQKGFNVHKAKNGVEALEFFEHNPIDVVVTDIMMPLMDGVELAKKINGRSAVVFMSGVESKEFTDKISDLSDAFLDKRIKRELLVEALIKAIKRWRIEHNKEN